MKNRLPLTNLLFIGLLMFLPLLSLQAQKKPSNVTTRKLSGTTQKVIDPRLTPPANRKFNHRFDIDVNYDKFQNRTKVQIRLPINSVESVHFAYLFNGEKLRQVPKEIIFLYFKDAERKFLFPVKDFIVLTDKERLRIRMVEAPELESDSKFPYLAKLDYPTFLRIANAEKVDMKIGDFEITFDDESLEALKDLASRTNPNFKEDAETAETKAIEKQVKAEVDKLIRTSSAVKPVIRQILEEMKLALSVSQSSVEPQIKQSAVGQASRTFIENKNLVPNGIFKEMLDSCMKDLVRADILNGISAGIIDKQSFDITEIVRQYNLSTVPEAKRPTVILLNAEETLTQLYNLAAMAKIIEID